MFRLALFKLTIWYLLILMGISFIFSVAIYNVATNEVCDRLLDLKIQANNLDVDGYKYPHLRDSLTNFEQNQCDAASIRIFTTLININTLILASGGIISYIMAQRSLRRIKNIHEAQVRFTGDASHELRTPLTTIRTELEVAMRDKKMSKTDMRRLLASNLEEINKLTSLSESLIMLSKLEHADLPIQSIKLDIVTSEIIQKYDKNAERIKYIPPKKRIYIKGNLASIERLVTILVNNALNYSSKGSTIAIKLRSIDKRVLFTIANSGYGIEADKLPYVFNRFYRADDSRSSKGSGLGLALAKEIVNFHRGKLSVKSERNGQTVFDFELPLYKVKAVKK